MKQSSWPRRTALAARVMAVWMGRLRRKASTAPDGETVVSYHLRSWPELPSDARSSDMLQTLSVMTQRDVTAAWFALRLHWPQSRAESFLEQLVASGAVQRIHTSVSREAAVSPGRGT